jgi:hypothetical protein
MSDGETGVGRETNVSVKKNSRDDHRSVLAVLHGERSKVELMQEVEHLVFDDGRPLRDGERRFGRDG